LEEFNGGKQKEHLTLHADDCMCAPSQSGDVPKSVKLGSKVINVYVQFM